MKSLLLIVRLLPVAILPILLTAPAAAQPTFYPLVRTPSVTAERHLPSPLLPYGEAMPAVFSKEPTDQEIFQVHFFEEPLVPSSKIDSAGENQALVNALAAFSQRKSADDFSSLLQFLGNYPKSRWRGSLLTDMGIVYRRTGYYNQAMNVWLEAWKLLKDHKIPAVKVLADRVLSELLLMNAWVGRYEQIDSLLKATDQRVLEGPAGERMVTIREGFWLMQNNPGISFKCGPFALNELYMLQDSAHRYSETLGDVQSTSKGFSLSQLAQLASQIGLHYQMAFRQPGSAVIPNAVVHWKLDHYSALLQNDSGSIHCKDATMGTTYGQEFWLTAAALDSSASGYFLVPQGSLPNGWRSVSASEGDVVFGKGQVPPDKGQHLSDQDKQVPNCNKKTPMAQCNVHAGAVSLHIYDRPVYYTPPIGPAVLWDVDYHQRDSYQPANFSYSNMGPKWTFQWLAYVQDNPASPAANAQIYLPGGGVRIFTTYNSTTKSYAPELQSDDVLVRVCANCYECRHPDGSKDVYARPDGSTANGRRIFLTQRIDPAGNAITLSYDASLRIVALQDAIGQVTTLSYENTADIYKVTKVTDPFGRSARFQYDSKGRLQSITDMNGIVSSFQYDATDFINQMTTPYGTTSFIKQEGPGNYLSLETHYPMGEKERVEFKEVAPGINFSEAIIPAGMPLFNQYISYRTTFYWDKKAMKDAPGDYTKARIFHWLHGSGATGENGYAAPILESVKDPLENRIWYDYQGQSSAGFANQGMSARPSIAGRVLTDKTTQTTLYTYNALGSVTGSTDPAGRKMSYVYDTSNNLLEVRQVTGGVNELLEQYTYNAQHLPLTKKDAAGNMTRYTYNAAGQFRTITNPRNEITSFTYDGNGYLTTITGAIPGSTLNFAYDDFGRLRTVTDAIGYTITTDYDVLDRPTLITYPDSSFEQTVYDRLDAVHQRDRLGRWTNVTYDTLERPILVEDPLGRKTQYNWCNCGSLSAITDPMNNTTSYTLDLQGRLTAQTYPNGKTVSYQYDSTTSRLRQITDAGGQKTQYSYFIDDNLKQITYANALIATPSVSLTYDTRYNRIATMTDGTGTTTYGYNPVGATPTLGAALPATVDGPLDNDLITFSYDSLGRLTARSINGVVSTANFDALGRVISSTNALGAFGYSYSDGTGRVAAINFPGGQQTTLNYFDNTGNQLLKQVVNKAANGSSLSTSGYTYNVKGNIAQWTQQSGNSLPNFYELGYDAGDQLITASRKTQRPAATLAQYSYKYDNSGNRVTEHISNQVLVSEYNTLNQMVRQWDADSLRTRGNVDSLAGKNLDNMLLYDDNGNRVTVSPAGVSYGWDAANRLVSISQGPDVTAFIYDGLGRRVAEKLNGNIIRRWLWDGTELAEERDAGGGTVTRRFFPQGEQIDGKNYYFTRDHLGSIREMTDSTGTIRARYDYDPYGRRIKVTGDLEADFGFTGHYYHPGSGLHLALYRGYDATTGRWLNRDPAGERGGLNLYGYAGNNPSGNVDPLGLYFGIDDAIFSFGGGVVGVLGQFGGDLISGKYGGWEDYAGSFVGGAVGGEALLYTGPVGAGVAGGAAGNLTKQALKNLTGKQCGFDLKSLGVDAALGGISGLFKGVPRIPGVNAGRGSLNQIYNQIVTKAKNNTINGITTNTAGNMFLGRAYDTGLLQGTAATSGISGWANKHDLLPSSDVNCACGK